MIHLVLLKDVLTIFIADANAQLLTVPPYAVSAVVLTLTSWASDRLQNRGLFMSAAAAVGGIGYLYVSAYEVTNVS